MTCADGPLRLRGMPWVGEKTCATGNRSDATSELRPVLHLGAIAAGFIPLHFTK